MHLTECDHAAVCTELCVATQLLVLHPDCAGPGDEIVLSQLLKIGLGVWFSFPHWLALSKSLSDINSLPPCSVLNNVHSLLENHKPSNASESSFLFFFSNFHSHFTNPIYQKHIKSNTLTYLFINTLPLSCLLLILPSSPTSAKSSPYLSNLVNHYRPCQFTFQIFWMQDWEIAPWVRGLLWIQLSFYCYEKLHDQK